MTQGEVGAALDEIRTLVGARLVTTHAVRDHHGRDESPFPAARPDAVVFPESTDEVSAILRACSSRRVPVIPFGAGTSLEGHVLATLGGLCMDMTHMNRVVALHPNDMDVVVQPGLTRGALNTHLRPHGLFFPVDPGADATLGGMAATGASGTTTVRYGAMRDNVLGMELVLPSGDIVQVGTRARKSSAGLDLTRLMVGSEGTLAVITRLTLRLTGVPEAVSAAVAQFATIGDAVSAAVETLEAGIMVARVELLDENAMAVINHHSGLTYPTVPTLFFEFHGSPASVEEQAGEVEEVARHHGSVAWDQGMGRDARDRLWEARHNAYFASLASRPGSRCLTTDVCVPLTALADCIVETQRDLAGASFPSTVVGHVGDGNFHVLMLVKPEEISEIREAHELNERLVMRALAADGTCTGEHGIGIGKRQFLRAESPSSVPLMKIIKDAFDPQGIMNPGKIFD